jgi:hypothetical protein
MKLALDASVASVRSEDLRRWLLLEDDVLFRQATITMGMEGLQELATEYLAKEDAGFEAAKTKFALANLTFGDIKVTMALLQEAVALLAQNGVPTRVEQQLQWQVLSGYAFKLFAFDAATGENARITALMEEAGKNPALRKDPFAIVVTEKANHVSALSGSLPFALNGGRRITDDDLCQAMTYGFENILPLLKQARDQSVGARREWHDFHRCTMTMYSAAYAICELFAFLLPFFRTCISHASIIARCRNKLRPQHE